MQHRSLISIALCAAAWYLWWPQPARTVEGENRDDAYYRTLDLAPVGPGPFELAKVFLQHVQFNFKQAAMISPDGRSIVYLEGGSNFAAERKILHIARLDARDSWTNHVLAMGALWQFGEADRSIPAYGWASNSSGVWTATREQIGPDGITHSGLQPAFIALADNGIQLFEPPRHAAGPLDGLLWADGDGLALAHFGARGASYQPQRHDKTPTFAMLDVKRGVVLDTLPFDVFVGLRDAYYITNVDNAAATRLQNGKVRALLSALDQWVVWTQGEPPRILPNPYPQERHNKLAISRDGSNLLVARLHCDGGYDETREHDGMLERAPMWPPCKPVESVIAALHDLETGRRLWEVRATVPRTGSYPNPAISDDGRYALVGLPSHSQLALISMDDGKIVQTFPSPGQGEPDSIGFFQGGRGVWIHRYGATVLYKLRAQ